MILQRRTISFASFILCFFILSPSSTSCTCVGAPMCAAINYAVNENAEEMVIARGLIVQTIKVNENRRDILIKVLESFYNPKGMELLRIRDGNSANCEFELDSYDIGDELIFFTAKNRSSYDYPNFGHCHPSGPLRVSGELVTGFITEKRSETMTLDQFRNLDCIPPSDLITLYPNPVANTLTLRSTALTQASDVEIDVINPMGQNFYTYRLTEEDKEMAEYQLDVRDWPVGTYYLALKGDRFPQKITPFIVMH